MRPESLKTLIFFDDPEEEIPWHEGLATTVAGIIMGTIATFLLLIGIAGILAATCFRALQVASVLAVVDMVLAGLWLISFIIWLVFYLTDRWRNFKRDKFD